jgi:polyphosphate:AMP phosphotransferase
MLFARYETGKTISKKEYETALPALRVKLLQAQDELKKRDFPVLIVISGVDASGKGEIVNLLHEWMDARFLLTYAFDTPSREERERPRFWRYWRALPPKGRIGIFFSSWYTYPILDRVKGGMKNRAFEAELDAIRHTEQLLTDDGMLLLKFWFHMSKDAQRKRLKKLESDPETRWRVTPTDWENYNLYDSFIRVCERVATRTGAPSAPWRVVEAVDRRLQALTVGRTILRELTVRLKERPPRKSSRSVVTARRVPDRLGALDLSQELGSKKYEKRLARWQGQLNRLVRKFNARDRSCVLVFEGCDAAGKGGAIRRITGALDARDYRIVPIAAPTEEERAHHYLWRFWRQLPDGGQVLIFDRSWYGRVMVERVEGFARPDEWSRAYAEIRDFERQLVDFGYVVVKFFLHISPDEQMRRFKEREETPWKRFKITEEDYRNQAKRPEYHAAVNELLERTSLPESPWTPVEANDKRHARVKILKTICTRLKNALK